jgi:hypothetical protein
MTLCFMCRTNVIPIWTAMDKVGAFTWEEVLFPESNAFVQQVILGIFAIEGILRTFLIRRIVLT